jgi:uncharacterized protein YidB (DUF937 family)
MVFTGAATPPVGHPTLAWNRPGWSIHVGPSSPEVFSGLIGGLAALAQAFQQNGLGKIFESRTGAGQNLPISATRIRPSSGPSRPLAA